MVKVLFKGFVFLILNIFFISFISATFTAGNPSYSIPTDYAPGTNITGWINVSFNNQPSNSSLGSSLGGSIKIMDLLNRTSNSGFVYTCNPTACTSNYAATNNENSKSFDLTENESIIIGLKLTGGKTLSSVSGFVFNLSSNNPETEKLPLSIDLLDDGKIEWNAYSPSNDFGTESYGCFVSAGTTQQLVASSPQYCEKINLSQSPEVEIGAYLTYVKGTGSVDYTMKIQRVDTGEYKSCTATASGSGLQRISCIPSNFRVTTPGDYFVCISAKSSADNGKYGISSEQDHPCGFTGNFAGTYNFDFEIFARQAEYAPAINLTFNSTELKNSGSYLNGIDSYIQGFLSSRYNNNCTNGCVIPIKIYSGVAQQISISDAFISYVSDTYTESRDIYNVQETPALVKSSFQKLYIDDAGFKTPTQYGNYSLSLSIDGNNFSSEQIFVEKVPVISSLTPETTAAKYPTKFSVNASSENNITEYEWDFGDGTSTQSTTTNNVNHTYEDVNSYTLKVTVHDSKGQKISKEFNINVGPASEIVPVLLSEAEDNFVRVQSDMMNFSDFEQKSINNSIDFDGIEQALADVNNSILEASSESDYETILGKLLQINVPNSISRTTSSSGIIFYPTTDNVNLDILQQIGGGNYSSDLESQYKDAILAWNGANVNTEMEYNEISATYSDYETPIVRTFDFHLTNTGNDEAYIIIKNMSNLLFGGDYSQKEVDGYYYIELTGSQQDILFSTTDNVDFVNLPMFISPALNKLDVTQATPVVENKNRWSVFILIVGIILAVAIVVWILLSMWYKKRYETFLFKDRNNLYNLITYIENSNKSGLNEKEITEKLKKSGWNLEQINYAMKKFYGKNTGLPQIIPARKIFTKIPVGKIFTKFKKNPIKKSNLPNKNRGS